MGAESAYELKLWHGLTPELFVSAAVIAVGAALMTRRRALYRRLEVDLLPGTGADALERIFAAAGHVGRRIAWTVAADHPRRHVGASWDDVRLQKKGPNTLSLKYLAVPSPGAAGPPPLGATDAGPASSRQRGCPPRH